MELVGRWHDGCSINTREARASGSHSFGKEIQKMTAMGRIFTDKGNLLVTAGSQSHGAAHSVAQSAGLPKEDSVIGSSRNRHTQVVGGPNYVEQNFQLWR